MEAKEKGITALPGDRPSETIDLAYWNTIKDSDELALYQAYLAKYPNGRFAWLAELAVNRLEGGRQEVAQKKDTRRHDESTGGSGSKPDITATPTQKPG